MGPVDPIAIELGPLSIHWYGVLIVLGAVLGGLVAAWQARYRGDDPDHIWNMLAVSLVLGIIGARLYHVFSSPAGGPVGWSYYREHPSQIFDFWNGGLKGFGIYGGIAGGILGVWLYARLAGLRFLRWLDYGAAGLILAQAIGRWGNFFNQELYGPPTDLPWGVFIEPAYRLAGYEAYSTFHPVFLYESILNLGIFLVLMWASRHYRHRVKDGDIFWGYLILYPFVRFWLEFLRIDAWMIGGIATAQIIALGAMVIGIAALAIRHRGKPAVEASKGPEAWETFDADRDVRY